MNEQHRVAIIGSSPTLLLFDEYEEMFRILNKPLEAPVVISMDFRERDANIVHYLRTYGEGIPLDVPASPCWGTGKIGHRAGQRRYHEQPTSLERLRAPRGQARLQAGAR